MLEYLQAALNVRLRMGGLLRLLTTGWQERVKLMDCANQRLIMHIAKQVANHVMDLPPSERLRAIKQEVGELRSLYQQALSDPEARVYG